MFRLFAHADFDFLSLRKRAFWIAGAFIGIGLVLLAVRGLNESIEFTGGTLLQIHATDPGISTGTLRSALATAGIEGAEIQTFGAPDEFVIRARLDPRADVSPQSTQETSTAVDDALEDTFGTDAYQIVRVEAVGPKVGAELRQRALLAIFLSFGATLIYLWFRFEWRIGVAAIAATTHDIASAIAFITMLNLEVSLVVVAALLTIVGYSLNDTIITFDRVRENLHKYKRRHFAAILNRSINETLPRTVLTSGTTISATIALLIFGSEVIRSFAWVMTFGVITGTFSSVYIASAVLLAIEGRWPGEDVRGAKVIPQAPSARSDAAD